MSGISKLFLTIPHLGASKHSKSISCLHSQFVHLQDVLLQVGAQLRTLEAVGLARRDIEAIEVMLDPIHQRILDIERDVAAIRADNLTDLALKADIARRVINMSDGESVDDLARSIFIDISALARNQLS